MAENDIYNSEYRYKSFVAHYKELALPPNKRNHRRKKAKYWCKNKQNMQYYQKLFNKFEAIDNSFTRRLRLLNTFNLIVHAVNKDLSICNRDDIVE